jgi:hypothetical protein
MIHSELRQRMLPTHARAIAPAILAALLSLAFLPPTRAAGPVAKPQETVTAVVVKSWSKCGSNGVVWEDLNAHWADFGSVPIHIDTGNPDLCSGGRVTYEALVASGAQTVILSDPAGGVLTFARSEVAALRRYAHEGHNLIGTFLLFAYGDVDNRALAPLFGLPSDVPYVGVEGTGPLIFKIIADDPLFSGMGTRYKSNGYPRSQAPGDSAWNFADNGRARYLAMARERHAAVIEHCAPAYRALYITHMPEYGGGREDKQLLYNAIVAGAEPGCIAAR